LQLASFVVENISLPEELQKMLDQRIGMNMLGDMGRYTQFQAAQSLPIAAANEGGVAGLGVGLGAGLSMGQQMVNAMNVPSPAAPHGKPPAPAGTTKFCTNCGQSIGRAAKFCPECGTPQ
jgi:membrane protease subunit (stomatin/prohibitin family)